MPKQILLKNFFILSVILLFSEGVLSQTNPSLQEKAKRAEVFAEFNEALKKANESLTACQGMRQSKTKVSEATANKCAEFETDEQNLRQVYEKLKVEYSKLKEEYSRLKNKEAD